jgi:hypothetical protein
MPLIDDTLAGTSGYLEGRAIADVRSLRNIELQRVQMEWDAMTPEQQARVRAAAAARRRAIHQTTTRRLIILLVLFAIMLAVGLVSIAVKTARAADIPPAEFDTPYAGVLVVERIAPEDIKKICSTYVACAISISTTDPAASGRPRRIEFSNTGNRVACIILMAPDWAMERMQPPQNPKEVLRHELGHCNGWPQNHPYKLFTNEGFAVDVEYPPNHQ